MLILIYGNDTFRVREKEKTLLEASKQKFDPTGMNMVVFPTGEGKQIHFGEAMQAFCSAPFMSEKRMVILRNLVSTLLKADEGQWIEGLKRVPTSSVVLVVECMDSLPFEKKPFFKTVSKYADVHSYSLPELQGTELSAWVRQRIQSQKGSIAQDALRELTNRVGADLWQMSHEIEKLLAYANGTEMTLLMVQTMVRASFEGEIFALVDAISRKEKIKALQLLNEERQAGTEEFHLMSMLSRQVRILLGARALLDQNPRATGQQLSEAMGLHAFVAGKALQQAKNFTFENLKQAHDLLFEYDEGMKSGGIEADVAVDLITARLIT